jgi:hypothetical protein
MKAFRAKSILYTLATVFLIWGFANLIIAALHWDNLGEDKFYSDVYSILNEVLPGAEIPFANAGSETERVNSLGYRGPDTTWAKPKGVRRVVSVGDSSTFGVFVSYDDSYTGRVAKKLAKLKSWETINTAIPGTNILQHRLQYHYKIYRLQPDIVMVYVVPNVRNDLDAFREFHDLHGRWRAEKTTAFQQFMRSWPLYRLMRNALKGPKAAGIKNQVELIYTQRRTMSESRRILDGFAKDLSALRKAIVKGGAIPVWVWHINRVSVGQHAARHTPPDSIAFNPMADAPEDYYVVLLNFTLQFGDVLVNPYPGAVAKAQEGAKIFVDEIHPTALGHKIIAEAVWDKMKALVE